MKTNIKSLIFSNCKKHSKTRLRTKKWEKNFLNNILIILYIQYIFSYGSNKKTCNTNPRNVNIKWCRDALWEREKVQLSVSEELPLYEWCSVENFCSKMIPSAGEENMCLNRCTCAISKYTDSDRRPQWEPADGVMEGNCVGWRQRR